jgi:hypothetical protein
MYTFTGTGTNLNGVARDPNNFRSELVTIDTTGISTLKYAQIIEGGHFAMISVRSDQLKFRLQVQRFQSSSNGIANSFGSPINLDTDVDSSSTTVFDIDSVKLPDNQVIIAYSAKKVHI